MVLCRFVWVVSDCLSLHVESDALGGWRNLTTQNHRRQLNTTCGWFLNCHLEYRDGVMK